MIAAGVLAALVVGGAAVSAAGRILPPPTLATDLAVAITAAPGPDDSELTGLRAETIAYLTANLPQAWRAATRGLGSVRVNPENPAIHVRVAASTGVASFTSANNRRDEIVVHVADAQGRLSPLNALSVTVQQLGHHWCCTGPGTVAGHWTDVKSDGELIGPNQFGLMNASLGCVASATGGEAVCPNAFSDRELARMGFGAVPRATNNPCVVLAADLERSIADSPARINTLKQQVLALENRLNLDQASISLIVNAFPGALPPAQLETYRGLVERYNATLVERDTVNAAQLKDVAAYNATLERLKGLLPCRP